MCIVNPFNYKSLRRIVLDCIIPIKGMNFIMDRMYCDNVTCLKICINCIRKTSNKKIPLI